MAAPTRSWIVVVDGELVMFRRSNGQNPYVNRDHCASFPGARLLREDQIARAPAFCDQIHEFLLPLRRASLRPNTMGVVEVELYAHFGGQRAQSAEGISGRFSSWLENRVEQSGVADAIVAINSCGYAGRCLRRPLLGRGCSTWFGGLSWGLALKRWVGDLAWQWNSISAHDSIRIVGSFLFH